MGRVVLGEDRCAVWSASVTNFEIRVHHGMATAMGGVRGCCGECVAAPIQQEGMLDTHDTGLTGNPNLVRRPLCSRSVANFEIRVQPRMATAMTSAGGMCGERVAAPTQ